MPESHELSKDQCAALLRAGVAGRSPSPRPTGPHIIPVNYSVVDGAIVSARRRTACSAPTAADTTLAFEIDQFDYPTSGAGVWWHAVAREVVHDRDEIEHIKSGVAAAAVGRGLPAPCSCGCAGPS